MFAPAYHDHFRTRLTHTLEAVEIARCLATHLRANETLAEVVTLAHDLGHPPFGHAGEVALNETMANIGGFNHNLHSLRVVDYLEHPFPAFRGLNLTAETREAIIAHVTPYDTPARSGLPESARPIPNAAPYRAKRKPQLQRQENNDSARGPSVEARIASLADRIAYNCHDLEDAIGAEFVTLDDLAGIRLWKDAYSTAMRESDAPNIHAVRRGTLDIILNLLLTDVIETSLPLLGNAGPVCSAQTAAESPASAHSNPVRPTNPVALSSDVEALLTELELFLGHHVYHHPKVATADAQGRETIQALVEAYRKRPDAMAPRFTARAAEQGLERVICDYIAGMTDPFCQTEHRRLSRVE